MSFSIHQTSHCGLVGLRSTSRIDAAHESLRARARAPEHLVHATLGEAELPSVACFGVRRRCNGGRERSTAQEVWWEWYAMGNVACGIGAEGPRSRLDGWGRYEGRTGVGRVAWTDQGGGLVICETRGRATCGRHRTRETS